MPKSKRAPSPAPEWGDYSRNPSLEDRVDTACRKLRLIHAAATADLYDRPLQIAAGTRSDRAAEEMLEAIAEMAATAFRALQPLRQAPGPVANWQPARGRR